MLKLFYSKWRPWILDNFDGHRVRITYPYIFHISLSHFTFVQAVSFDLFRVLFSVPSSSLFARVQIGNSGCCAHMPFPSSSDALVCFPPIASAPTSFPHFSQHFPTYVVDLQAPAHTEVCFIRFYFCLCHSL